VGRNNKVRREGKERRKKGGNAKEGKGKYKYLINFFFFSFYS